MIAFRKAALVVSGAAAPILTTGLPAALTATLMATGVQPAAAQTRNEVRLHPRLAGRISELEQELRIMKNRMRAMERRNAGGRGKGAYVQRTNKRVRVLIDGQVHRAILATVGNGNSEVQHVDGDQSSTRLRIRGLARAPGGWNVEARIEFEMEVNPSNRTDDTNIKNTFPFTLRKGYVSFQHRRWGRFAFGHESTATDGIAEMDLSGTQVGLHSDIEKVGGGFRFSPIGNQAGGTTLRTVWDAFDGQGLQNVFRYDTPKFYGFWVAVSHADGDVFSLGLRYYGNLFGLKDFKVGAAFGWDHVPTDSETAPGNAQGNVPGSNQYSGSVSILHVPTGLSITYAMGTAVLFGDNTNNPWSVYLKLGWQTKSITALGRTAFGVDVFHGRDRGIAGAKLRGLGFGVVQRVDEAAMDLYFVYRLYDLKIGAVDQGTIHVFMFGTRVKF